MMAYDDFLEQYIADNRDLAIRFLMEQIQIPSIKSQEAEGAPYGPEVRRMLDTAAAQMKALGFETYIPDHGKYGYCDLGSGEKTVGIMPHLDVVPAPGQWSHPPFAPYVKDGHIYGRGSSDDKGGTVAAMFALDAIRKSGVTLKSKVQLIFGCNEETGMEDVAALKADGRKPDFTLVPDAFYAIGVGHKGRLSILMDAQEKFEDILSFSGGDPSGSSVPDRAECRVKYTQARMEALKALAAADLEIGEENGEIHVVAHGVSAHPAMPFGGKNAVTRLAEVMAQVLSLPEGDRQILENLAAMTRGCTGEGLGICGQDTLSGPLTAVCVRAVSEAKRLTLKLNVRFCVTMKKEPLFAAVSAKAGDYGFRVVSSDQSNSHLFPTNHPAVHILQEAYRGVTGEEADLYVHPGGTYAALLGDAVIMGNEFRRPSPLGPTKGRAHQTDELTSIEDLMKSIRIYFYSLIALSNNL